jgi:CRP/FNR family transcriptional regulator, polysaccharide utilization system transcription regulator
MMESNNTYTSCCVGQHRCNCFNILTPEEHDYLFSNSVLVKFSKQEIIYKQGGLVSNIMVVESGLVKVFIEDENNMLVLKIVTAGNLLGMTSISEKNNTYQYNAMTYVDSVIRQIDINVFRTLVKQNPTFAKEIIDMLNSNSIQINNRFFCLSHKQSFGRLADILLCLSERVFQQSEFELPLSRKELAELTGLKSETVIRLLKQFSDEGIIDLNGKKIHIKDNPMLRKISEKG